MREALSAVATQINQLQLPTCNARVAMVRANSCLTSPVRCFTTRHTVSMNEDFTLRRYKQAPKRPAVSTVTRAIAT